MWQVLCSHALGNEEKSAIISSMAKRAYVDIRRKKSRSRKTAKRLEIKGKMLAALGAKRRGKKRR